ncbi:MAG: hypothetical protein E7256_14065 [Lachnospiraceae bacterium]|nr:hypothetical protein [Lachnospiraceae bacterium]
MKRFAKAMLSVMLTLVLAVSMVAVSAPEEAKAAAVCLNTTWKTVYMGNSYTFWVKNASNVKSKTWSSSKKWIATVNGKGQVTPVAVGKSTIKCKITYTDGTTQTVSAIVSVKEKVPATGVTLTNKNLGTNNMQTIEVGSSYSFKFEKTPSNTTDYAYFTVADTAYASVTNKGVVKGLKAGVTVLEVRTGASAAAAKTSEVVDRVYLNIVDPVTPTPTPIPVPQVEDVAMVSSKEIQIKFSSEILESSVIDASGNLIAGTVTIGLGTDAAAVTPLTPVLSSDKKTLSLTTASQFKGTYVITISKSIKAADGTEMTPYTVQKEMEDTTGPIYLGSEVDDSGYVCTFNFNEPIDISEMSVYSVTGTNNTSLKAMLSTASNYQLSADKKSLKIDLSGCGETSANVTVKLLGIKDLVGNVSVSFPVTALAKVDATTKPLATIVSAERVSKTTLKVTFSRAMVYPGYVIIDGETISGVIDASDNKVVTYTLVNTALTGAKVVQFSGWYSYNAPNYQTDLVKRSVNFTLDTTAPMVTNYTLVNTTKNNTAITTLTLTYNKDISVVEASGTMASKVQSTTGNIYAKTLTYTASASKNVLTVVFGTGQASDNGTYTITVPAGIVMDTYGNLSKKQGFTMTKQLDSSSALPAPSQVIQDSTNPSKVYVYFGAKLDLTAACNVNNYTFASTIHPTSAVVSSQDESSAIVELTFAAGALSYTSTYPVVISGLKGYNGSYAEMETYKTTIAMVDNVPAMITSGGCKLTSNSFVTITLTEPVTGKATVVVNNGGTLITTDCMVSGDTLYIALNTPITGSSYYLMFTENNLVDVYGNEAAINLNTPIGIVRSY